MKCLECDGRGAHGKRGYYGSCPTCHGTGKVEELQMHSYEVEDAPMSPKNADCICEYCKANGYYRTTDQCPHKELHDRLRRDHYQSSDKPEMPERIWAWNDRLQGYRFGVEENIRLPLPVDKEPVEYLRADLAVAKEKEVDNLKMLLEEANKQIAALADMIASMTDQLDNSLPKGKVRELVKAVDVLRNYAWDCMEVRKQTEKFVQLNCPVESLINALFPEGVEK